MQLQILNPLNVLNCCFYCGRFFTNECCDKYFKNKPAFKTLCLNWLEKFIADFTDLHTQL